MAKKESKKQQIAPVQEFQAEPQRVDFDAWWAMTQKRVPEHHRKEIVLADFKARGLSMKESTATFNKALGQYGVKLG